MMCMLMLLMLLKMFILRVDNEEEELSVLNPNRNGEDYGYN